MTAGDQVGVAGQDFRDDAALGGVGDAYGQPCDVAFFVLQTLGKILVESLDPAGVFDHDLPFRRGLQPFFSPDEKSGIQIVLQLLDVLAHCRLCQGQLFCCSCKISCLIDFQ